MPDVIFARPRYDYGSYVDLYRLISLSGYRLIFFDEIDPQSDNCYILTMVNGENQAGYPDAAARIILYDLEWRLTDPPKMPGVAEVWAADKWYSEQIGARYVPLGSHVEFPDMPLQDCPKQWDVAMMAYLPPRREKIVHDCGQMGVAVAPRGWALERHDILQKTRIMLHVHQHDGISTVAPQRWAIAAAYRMPIIAEVPTAPGIFTLTYGLYSDYAHLAEFARLWRYEQRLADYALALHELLCHTLTFGKSIEAAL